MLPFVKKVLSLINVYVSNQFSLFFFFLPFFIFLSPTLPCPEGGKSNQRGTNISYDS